MTAYKDALAIDDSSSEQCLQSAVQLLRGREGIVLFNNVLALRPAGNRIICEVIDPYPDSHRCAEEFKVLVENAGRELANSSLGSRLPDKPLHWLVVADNGTAAVELWPGH